MVASFRRPLLPPGTSVHVLIRSRPAASRCSDPVQDSSGGTASQTSTPVHAPCPFSVDCCRAARPGRCRLIGLPTPAARSIAPNLNPRRVVPVHGTVRSPSSACLPSRPPLRPRPVWSIAAGAVRGSGTRFFQGPGGYSSPVHGATCQVVRPTISIDPSAGLLLLPLSRRTRCRVPGHLRANLYAPCAPQVLVLHPHSPWMRKDAAAPQQPADAHTSAGSADHVSQACWLLQAAAAFGQTPQACSCRSDP